MEESSSMCRTCMKQDGDLVSMSHSLYPTEMNPSATNTIMNAFTECTAIQIDEGDNLPQVICANCLTVLITSFEFRQQALQVDSKLKQQLVGSKIKNEISSKAEVESNVQTDDFGFYTNYQSLEFSNLLKEETPYFECKKCFQVYQCQNELSKHITSHKEKRGGQSSSRIGKEPVEELLHRSMSDAIKNFEANENIHDEHENETGIILDAGYLLKDYTEEQTGENLTKFQCNYCNMEFIKRKSLVNHLKKHEESSYHCEVCGLLFTKKTLLNRHKKLHSDEKPYKCTKCNKSYSRSDQFKDHMKRHDGIKPKTCPYCNKGFTQSCSLKEHIRTHTGEVPFLCSQCGKGFNNSSNLRQHMRRHSGIKPYTCSLCPKTFYTKGQMTGHLATHSDAHPYTCSQCGAAFTKVQSLKKHAFIHLGLKPFECDVCPMRFPDRNHLKRHQRTHTGEKPYQCKYCERAFAQSNDLVKHLRIHFGKNVYRCSECGMRFRLQTELRRHYPCQYKVNATPPQEVIVEPAPVEKQLPPLPREEQPPPPPQERMLTVPNVLTKTHDDGRITITFTGKLIDKSTFHDGFTIDMMPEKR